MRSESSVPTGLPSAFHLVVLVWGASYTRRFVELALPALMSPRNIPALMRLAPVHLTVYTTEADRDTVAMAPVLNGRDGELQIRFITRDWPGFGDKCDAMRVCHSEALITAARENAAVLFLAPDTIWADGSLETVARAVLEGKRAVMQAGVRVNEATALPLILERFRPTRDHAITVPARDLVRIALDHMHPFYRSWYWDAPAFSRHPANVYWRVGDEGMVVRGFHLHPLMVFPERQVQDFVSTVDDDLAVLAFTSYDSIYVVRDSDDVFHIDLADEDWGSATHTLEDRPTASYLATWGRLCGNLYHRRFVMEKIRFHAGPLTPAWRPVEEASDRVLQRVARSYAIESLALRPRELVFGTSREALLERVAASRLGPDTMPPPPSWWDTLTGLLPSRFATALQARRTRAFRSVLEWIFGTNVTVRGLGLVLADEKRAKRLERVARPGVVYATKQRVRRAQEFGEALRASRGATVEDRLRLLKELKERTAKERRLDRPLPSFRQLLPTATQLVPLVWLLFRVEMLERRIAWAARWTRVDARTRRLGRIARRRVRRVTHTAPRRTRHATRHVRKAGRKIVVRTQRNARSLVTRAGRRVRKRASQLARQAYAVRKSMLARSRRALRSSRRPVRTAYKQLRLVARRFTGAPTP